MSVRILIGDCRARMAELPDASVDSVVCDPPYHLTSIVKRFSKEAPAGRSNLEQPADKDVERINAGQYKRLAKGFMGQTWDGGDVAFNPATWAEVLRVLKPGGHLVAFSGTRTYHRMVCAIEDAGFEIRDQLAWVYGSGFPKSHDVSKGIDRHNSDERPVVGSRKVIPGVAFQSTGPSELAITSAASAAWQGWGTALKPSWEPICLARKPLIGTVAANVLAHGTGAINIDGCRVSYASEGDAAAAAAAAAAEQRSCQSAKRNFDGWGMQQQSLSAAEYLEGSAGLGRWPANLCHDGSEEALAGFPSTEPSQQRTGKRTGILGAFAGQPETVMGHDDEGGSAARFFYCAKATTDERGEGNNHPTVKPVALMRWLCRLITPKGGTVLDPFMGSGSTLLAADAEQFNAIGCELSPEYAAIAERRLKAASGLFADVSVCLGQAA